MKKSGHDFSQPGKSAFNAVNTTLSQKQKVLVQIVYGRILPVYAEYLMKMLRYCCQLCYDVITSSVPNRDDISTRRVVTE